MLIGAGKIGSRHLQGLSRIPTVCEITVVDPSNDSLKVAQQRYHEVEDFNEETIVNFRQTIPKVNNLDLVIIATSSDVRKKVIIELLGKSNPKYFILEKVAFQNIQDFEEIIRIFQNKKIKCWINCPNRALKSYQNLKVNLEGEENIHMHISGGNWGLASNTIHYLDLFSFLIETDDLEVCESFIDQEVYPSKREGFLELGGTLIIKSKKNDLLLMSDIKSSNRPVNVTISTENHHIIINESLGESEIQTKKNSWKKIQSPFELTNQSTLTTDIVLQIFKKGTSNLISLEESFKLHKIMIPFFLDKMKEISDTSIDDCPIT